MATSGNTAAPSPNQVAAGSPASGSTGSRLAGLFGSDVYEDYTAVYTWNSNQMAHAMMGFAGTTLMAHGALVLGLSAWWGLLFVVIPALKDTTDYAVDKTRAGHIFAVTRAYNRELIADGFTDNYFWNVGTLFAVFLAVSPTTHGWPLYGFVGVAAVSLAFGIRVLGGRYGAEKRRFDAATLPYLFRLPNFAGNPVAAVDVTAAGDNDDGDSAAAIRHIEAFAYGQADAARHLVVWGAPNSRKTTLAAALGSELTVRKTAVRYLSRAALVEALAAPRPREAGDGPLPPLSAEVVIVDDVGLPFAAGTVPGQLAERRTVWVIADPATAADWRRQLRGALKGRMVGVELGQPRDADRVDIRAPRAWARLLPPVTLGVAAVALVGSLLLVLWPR